MNPHCRHRRFAARKQHASRHGVALFSVMICLVVVSTLLLSWLRTVALERQQLLTAEGRLQAEWLAEAALERAAAKLKENSEYAGETWTVSADELAGDQSAAIEIHVAAVAGQADRRAVEIVVDYSIDSLEHVRQSKQVAVDVGKAGSKDGAN